MHVPSVSTVALAAAATAFADTQRVAAYNSLPSLTVHACPKVATITYSHSVPEQTAFPTTEVELCYVEDQQTPSGGSAFLHINFTAYAEPYFYYDPSMGTNDPLYEYEVMETFISRGTNDPQTYLEFEVNPGNATWQAFVYNPSKVRAPNATFTNFPIDPFAVGIAASTVLDEPAGVWSSYVQIPLGLFNVDRNSAKGTEWRMNFFRIVESEESYPDQTLGAWSPPDEASFHKTPFFGYVKFA
ncbi:hypothetical protein TruAng_004376 [Truncatella angustata]|nr:hypothetical protein TruAng_004376 [Truncatella angustata]